MKCYVVHYLSTASTPEETSPPQTVETTFPPQTVETTSHPVSSSTQPTNNPQSDGATTTSVIIVVAVVIVLVVIVIGVVILVVIFSTKKRKQQSEIKRIQNVKIENGYIEMKPNQEQNTEKEANSRPDHSLYHVTVKQKKMLPSVPTKSEKVEYLKQKCTLSEEKPVPAESEYALPAKSPLLVNLSKSMFEELESNPMYQSMDRRHDPPSTTNVSHGNDIYTVPVTTSSTTIEMQSGFHETVYQASPFTDVPRNPIDYEHLQSYAPQSCKKIYCNAGHTTRSS